MTDDTFLRRLFPPDSPRWGLMLALISTAGFSMKAIFAKIAFPYGIDVASLVLLRMVFSVPLFWWLAVRHHQQSNRIHLPAERTRLIPKLSIQEWAGIVGLGFCGYYLSSYLDFAGLQYISAALERLILYTYPTFTMLIGWALYRKRPHNKDWWGLLLCYGGIAIAFVHDINVAPSSAHTTLGALLVLGSSMSYALYLSTCQSSIARLGSFRFSALCMSVSTLMIVLHYALRQDSPEALLSWPWQVYATTMAMAAMSTVLPVVCMSEAIRILGANLASLSGMMGPLLTIFFGWWLLSEPISWQSMVGAVLVIAGVVLANRKA